MSEAVKMAMRPYRTRIDELDKEIITLLRRRYDVIEEVGEFKAYEEIDPVIQERVDEVRENARRMASEHELDSDFIADLYAQLIDHSCQLEVKIIADLKAKNEKKA